VRNVRNVFELAIARRRAVVMTGASSAVARDVTNAVDAHITCDVARALERDGFAVVDAFLDDALAHALRASLERLAAVTTDDDGGAATGAANASVASPHARDRKYLRPNRTHFTKTDGSARYLFSKPNIYECDLADAETLGETRDDDAYAALWGFYDASSEAFARAFARVAPELRLEPRAEKRVVKAQLNVGGGGCFPWHYDNPGPPSNRAVTAILYLNPQWRDGDGGELVLQPFCAGAARVAPRHNRLAIFYSDRTLHRVMPSTASTRYALTVWLDGNFTTPDGSSTNASVLELNASEAMRDVAATAATLRQSNAQRALSRAVYADEYEQSLVECMSNAPRGMEEMLEAHYEHCRAVKKQPGLKALVDALREHRRQVEANTREKVM